MERPCHVEHPYPEQSRSTCRICFLYETDTSYRRLWGGDTSQIKNKNHLKISLPICEHRGNRVHPPHAPDNFKEWYRCDSGLGIVCPCGICNPNCHDYSSGWEINKKHLLFHVMPVSHKRIWQLDIAQVLTRKHLFNGQKLFAIVRKDSRTHQQLDPPEDVISFVSRYVPDADFLIIDNDPDLREVASWLQLWPYLESSLDVTDDDVVLWAHAKGVTRPVNEGVSVHPWAKMLYELLLDFPQTTDNLLLKHPIAGAFLKNGHGFDGSDSRWHYSGGMFWVRYEFAKNAWSNVDRVWWGTEAWPGVVFENGVAGTIFKRGFVPELNLYDADYLRNTMREYEEWKSSKLTANR